MGAGMSLVMTDIGAVLGAAPAMAVGIGLGIIGIILVCLGYPIYNCAFKKERKKLPLKFCD